MIKAVVFDFDGVLAESTNIKTRAYARLFENENNDLIEKITSYHLKFEGVSRFEKFKFIYREILKRHLSDNEFESLCNRYSKLVIEEVTAAPWVQGAEKFLQKNRGKYKFFIVSGTPQDELREIIKRRGYKNFFNEILGSPATKDIHLDSVIKKYGLQCKQVVFVGDAETDWIAARKTGVHFIWRRVSSKTPPLIDFSGPTISSLSQLGQSMVKHLSPKSLE